jgi:hypothetical protein
MGDRIQAAEEAMTRNHDEVVREGTYVAEVPIELIEEQDDWSPYRPSTTHVS